MLQKDAYQRQVVADDEQKIEILGRGLHAATASSSHVTEDAEGINLVGGQHEQQHCFNTLLLHLMTVWSSSSPCGTFQPVVMRYRRQRTRLSAQRRPSSAPPLAKTCRPPCWLPRELVWWPETRCTKNRSIIRVWLGEREILANAVKCGNQHEQGRRKRQSNLARHDPASYRTKSA